MDRSGVQEGPLHHSLVDQQRSENFPVALRVLPRSHRRHLVAVYDVARTMDDLADEAAGDRLGLLHDFGVDLERVWVGGEPSTDVLRRLVPTVHELGLSPDPFRRLLAAGVQDQQVSRYETYDELLDYCRLSADPVGQLVLAVFGVRDPRATALSDRICTALQLLEHWQDVAEDRRNGRVYLPQEDLRAYGVTPADLDAGRASAPLRRLMAFEVERASELLDQGAPLVRLLHGWARVAVTGYVAGGRGTVMALRRTGGDVLAASPRPRRRDVAGHGLRLALGAR